MGQVECGRKDDQRGPRAAWLRRQTSRSTVRGPCSLRFENHHTIGGQREEPRWTPNQQPARLVRERDHYGTAVGAESRGSALLCTRNATSFQSVRNITKLSVRALDETWASCRESTICSLLSLCIRPRLVKTPRAFPPLTSLGALPRTTQRQH
jgi:hypothetical protein